MGNACSQQTSRNLIATSISRQSSIAFPLHRPDNSEGILIDSKPSFLLAKFELKPREGPIHQRRGHMSADEDIRQMFRSRIRASLVAVYDMWTFGKGTDRLNPGFPANSVRRFASSAQKRTGALRIAWFISRLMTGLGY